MEAMQIVIIEDQEAHFQLMKRAIIKEYPSAAIRHFPNAGTCLERLGDLNPDIIVADYLMPGMNGIEFLETLQRDSVSSSGDSEIPIEGWPDIEHFRNRQIWSGECRSKLIFAKIIDVISESDGKLIVTPTKAETARPRAFSDERKF